MKFTFNKKNNACTDTKNSIWQNFEKANVQLQYKCANWLERKTAHFSRLHWIAALFIFIMFTSGLSIYLMAASFSENTAKNITVIPITKSRASAPLNENPIEIHTIISKAELEKIAVFRRYMDSLGRSAAGIKIHDSIVLMRPGLLDSLVKLENYYYSHLKN
jgi:hypothetical protein